MSEYDGKHFVGIDLHGRSANLVRDLFERWPVSRSASQYDQSFVFRVVFVVLKIKCG